MVRTGVFLFKKENYLFSFILKQSVYFKTHKVSRIEE